MSTSPIQIHQPEAAEAESLGDRAYFAIRELVVALELAPGSSVSERELQKRLGVGRTPVREALQRLEGERLVEVYPRRGIFVSNVNVLDPGCSPRCARCSRASRRDWPRSARPTPTARPRSS